MRDFPAPSDEDSYVTRREFTKFLGLTSLAFFIGTLAAAGRKLWKSFAERQAPPLAVAAADELPVGGFKLFNYPAPDDHCILLRLDETKFVAFDQHCTHLACPVVFDAAKRQLACPCHKGFFDAEDGRVLAGPAKRPLTRLAVSIRDRRVWAELSAEERA